TSVPAREHPSRAESHRASMFQASAEGWRRQGFWKKPGSGPTILARGSSDKGREWRWAKRPPAVFSSRAGSNACTTAIRPPSAAEPARAAPRWRRCPPPWPRDSPGAPGGPQTDAGLKGGLVRLRGARGALRGGQPGAARAFSALATKKTRRKLLALARHFYG